MTVVGLKKKLDDYIHFKTNNMQICEDMQMIVMNFVLQKITCQKFKFWIYSLNFYNKYILITIKIKNLIV
jgi:hypothetical protein